MIYKNYEYFLTIAKLGSLTKAAEALYITQPSLSKYLSRLEESLDICLFDRSRSPMVLTHAGQLYYDYLNSIISQNKVLETQFDEIREGIRGNITLGITTWRSSIILPKVLPSFRQRYPGIRVDVMEGKSYSFERAMLNNQVDFCLTTTPCNFNLATSYESLGMERIFLVGNIEHPIVKKAMEQPSGPNGFRKIDVSMLNGEMFIDLKPGQLLHQVNHRFFIAHEVKFRDVWTTESTDTALNLVNCTPSFTTVPALCLQMNMLPPNIVLFELGDPPLEWELAIVYPKGAQITNIMRLFINEIKEFYRKIGNASDVQFE